MFSGKLFFFISEYVNKSTQRSLLYKDLRQMCESIKKGEYSSKKGELFAVSLPAPVDISLI